MSVCRGIVGINAHVRLVVWVVLRLCLVTMGQTSSPVRILVPHVFCRIICVLVLNHGRCAAHGWS